MGVPDRQRTVLDILSSSALKTWCQSSPPTMKSRERTMQILVYILNTLVTEGNSIYDICETDGPSVPIDTYLTRFFKYTPCKKDVFIVSLIYLDKKITKCGLIINSTNVHREFLTCNLMAAKLVEERAQGFPVSNKLFAIVGGIPLAEMNDLEMDFLADMDFRLHIFPEEFHEYAQAMRSKLSLLKDVYNANKDPFEEINAKSTYFIYKQFTENVKMMEKAAAQQQYNNRITSNTMKQDYPPHKQCVTLVDNTPIITDKSEKRKKKKRNNRKRNSQ